MTDNRNNKLHPHKFVLWVGIGSILMMFAGLTSAYIVKRNMAGWQSFDLPQSFWYSALVVAISSFTIWQSVRNFKLREMRKYRGFLAFTAILGLIFVALQTLGFYELFSTGLGLGKSTSVDFLYVIVGLHALHVIGGVIVLFVIWAKAFNKRERIYSSIPIEVASTYWHFVGILWVYLLIFLVLIK